MNVAKLSFTPAAFAIQLGQVYESLTSHLLTVEYNANTSYIFQLG